MHDVLDLSMEDIWQIAKTGTTMELSSVGSHLQDRHYASVVAPRHHAALHFMSAGAHLATPTRASSASALRELPAPSVERGPTISLDRLAGSDPVMQALISQSKRLVDRKVNLLIQGETGSGKEVFAKALHEYSNRARKPFVAVNCASIPESLIESELFGYTPGCFTGGRSKGMKGLILQSEGGTLFLDEIGDMPLQLQTRFLRVLSEGEVLPLGSDRPIAVNCTVIAATHRGLRERVEAGTFREDLYYRLAGATLCLPALRDRADQRYLIETIFRDEAQRLNSRSTLPPEIIGQLMAHPWPGNVRELRSALRYAIALSDDAPVTLADLPAEVTQRSHALPHALALPMRAPFANGSPASPLEASGEAPEGEAIGAARLLQALRHHKWNVTRAAEELALCRATVYRQMKRFGITPPNRL